MSGNSQKYTQRWENKPEEKKQKSNTHEPNHKKNNYDNQYTSQQYNNSYSRQNDKPYNHSKKNDKSTKQTQRSNIYKYKIERDESGNCRYVLENQDYNPLNLINNREFVCIYPSNGTKYYKNVNIYNYKKKIII